MSIPIIIDNDQIFNNTLVVQLNMSDKMVCQTKLLRNTALACFERRFKNHRPLTRDVGTHLYQKNKLKSTMNISNRPWPQFNISRKGLIHLTPNLLPSMGTFHDVYFLCY